MSSLGTEKVTEDIKESVQMEKTGSQDIEVDQTPIIDSILSALRNEESRLATANKNWTSERLDILRKIGDVEVDAMVKHVIPGDSKEAIGRLGYNDMLLLADQIMKTPELAFVKESRLAKQLQKKPEYLVDYFDPMVAPDWVDEDKIKIGAKVWQDNTLIVLAALYSGSLPACYLIKNGIPALYQSEKLKDAKYIYQRIYETGLMLADTMDAGGLSIVEDSDYDENRLLIDALRKLDKKGNWKQSGHCCSRESTTKVKGLDKDAVNAEIKKMAEKPTRYIWGKGYLAAKKVRFLHASMRYMLTSPELFKAYGNAKNPNSMSEALSQRKQPWDSEKFGVPINQEDLAYTLLTFGFIIPKCLDAWGVPISRQQKEGFLHLWKVIGHIMGIEDELLTDDWDEAEALFALIQKRQAGYSHDGVALTESLMQFFADYLPHFPGFAHRVSTVMVINQIGLENASYIIPENVIKEVNVWWRRPFYSVAGKLAQVFFGLRGFLSKRFSHLGGMTAHRLHEASLELVESWRGSYMRKPFFVPLNSTTWIRKPGVDEQHIRKLTQWRRKLFSALGICVSLLAVSVFSFSAAFFLWWSMGETATTLSLIVAVTSWMTAMGLMNSWMPVIFKQRPTLNVSPDNTN